MLYQITGIIKHLEEQCIVVDCGALAFSLCVPREHAFSLHSSATLYTHLHWHQEQGPTLFGFTSELERTTFLMIISCSGIGPKIGLAILGQLGTQPFLQAVQTNNESALSSVSGIGPKKAEQIMVQLRHKVAKLLKSGVALEVSPAMEQWQNVADVLSSLNYSRAEVANTMKYLGDTYAGQPLPFDQLMRHALSFLAKKT